MKGALPYILIGNPENRRVILFQQALANQGLPPATVVAWRELISGPDCLSKLADEPALLRIDSAGEDFEVERALLRLGHTDARLEGVSYLDPRELDELPYDHGRILPPRQLHLGFLRLLRLIDEVLCNRPRWRVLSPPSAIAELFDKRATSQRYSAAGIPVPPSLPGGEPSEGGRATSIASPDGLRAAMVEQGLRNVFVKLASGSSASCLAIFHHSQDRGGDDGDDGDGCENEYLITTIEDTPRAWYNTLRVRRITERARIDKLLAFLIREGSQIEQAMPKARLDGAFFDCRVLLVGGEPAFVVVRQNRHPITNLHLGGWRGDLKSLEAQLPAELEKAAMDSCRRVAELHGCFQLGVDLLYEAGWRGHRVIEANAFGDLLPRLTREGLSVYEWQIHLARQATTPRW